MKETESTISDTIAGILDQVIHDETESIASIHQLDNETLLIQQQEYSIVKNYRDGFNKDAFIERYDPFFEKYDFIVGDWAHEKLRLRGFYQLNRKRVPRDQQIDFLEDYLKEYCSFGCAYFVLAKSDEIKSYQEKLQNQAAQDHEQLSGQTKSKKRRRRRKVNTRKETHKKKTTKEHPRQSEPTFNIRSSRKESNAPTIKNEAKSSNDFVIKKRQAGRGKG